MHKIPFNIPCLTGDEEKYILQALRSKRHCGNYEWGKKCIDLMKELYGFKEIFLTPSGTAALEMGAILSGLKPGDEVILPSYTFSSTANAIVLQGAKPIFCEIDPDTMNMDVNHIEELITEKTKMLLPIDYAGIPCDVEAMMRLANKHQLTVMVDAAQSIHSKDKNGNFVGTVAPLATFSFHETKNISCGEGGALIVNNEDWIERAHFLQEKGTDRRLVLSGLKNKYGWVDVGSSFLLADILAAMLYTQLENVQKITDLRGRLTKGYNEILSPFEKSGYLKIPHVQKGIVLNHHAFFVIFNSSEDREIFLTKLKAHNIFAYIGYVPLHSSDFGKKFGYHEMDLPLTEDLGKKIVRLPMYADISEESLAYLFESMENVLKSMFAH